MTPPPPPPPPHSPPPSPPAGRVSVAVTINAEPETVWRFLSDQEKLLAWMTYLPGAPVPPGSAFEPRPGGAVRLVFPNGGAAVGSVLEVDPPRRLVFSWGYEPDVAKTGLGPGACRVEITLAPAPGDDGTRVTLTHSGPMSGELAQGHLAGWRHYLSQLARQAAASSVDARLEAALRDYFAACNQPDAPARDALLAACCDPALRVRTFFACCDSAAEFSAHIDNGLRHLRGALSAPSGPARHIHGFVRVPWAVAMGDRVLFRGENLLRLTPAGKIAEIIGFQDGT